MEKICKELGIPFIAVKKLHLSHYKERGCHCYGAGYRQIAESFGTEEGATIASREPQGPTIGILVLIAGVLPRQAG